MYASRSRSTDSSMSLPPNLGRHFSVLDKEQEEQPTLDNLDTEQLLSILRKRGVVGFSPYIKLSDLEKIEESIMDRITNGIPTDNKDFIVLLRANIPFLEGLKINLKPEVEKVNFIVIVQSLKEMISKVEESNNFVTVEKFQEMLDEVCSKRESHPENHPSPLSKAKLADSKKDVGREQ